MSELDILIWKQKRVGKITSSQLPKLMGNGRGDKIYTDTAMAAMWAIRYERRTGCQRPDIKSFNFDFGHEQEARAIASLRKTLTFSDVVDCANDCDEIPFFEVHEIGFGDSPDFLIYRHGELIAIGEIKSPLDIAKIERYNAAEGIEDIDETDEYFWQLMGHFIGNPSVEEILYIIWDANTETFAEFSLVRSQYESDIERARQRIADINDMINYSLKHNISLDTLNSKSYVRNS